MKMQKALESVGIVKINYPAGGNNDAVIFNNGRDARLAEINALSISIDYDKVRARIKRAFMKSFNSSNTEMFDNLARSISSNTDGIIKIGIPESSKLTVKKLKEDYGITPTEANLI